MLKQAEIDAAFAELDRIYSPDAIQGEALEAEKNNLLPKMIAIANQMEVKDIDPSLDLGVLAKRVEKAMQQIISSSLTKQLRS